MGAVTVWATALALGIALNVAPCRAQDRAPWHAYVGDTAARFGIPEEWVWRVIAAESGGRTHRGGRPVTSPAGAMGLMQVMPATWSALRADYGLGADPYEPRDNIVAGTAYLRAMYDRFGYPGLFAAYNAGPGRYGEYLSRGRPLPRETRDYVARITGGMAGSTLPQAAPAQVDFARKPLAEAAPRAAPRNPIFLPIGAAPATAAVSATGPRSPAFPRGSAAEARKPDAGGSLFVLRRSGANDPE